MFGVKKTIKMVLLKQKWRKLNSHNLTIANSLFNPEQVKVGKKTYGELNISLGTNPKRTIKIGDYCSIAPDVCFIINPHNYKFFSTWGWQIYEYHERYYDWEKKTSIIIEDDVWIGKGATILGGAVLRQGCVIGANSVVSSEIPPYAIYAGGRIIKYRFSEQICKKLLQIDYSKFDDGIIKKLQGWHRIEITEDNIDKMLEILPLKE